MSFFAFRLMTDLDMPAPRKALLDRQVPPPALSGLFTAKAPVLIAVAPGSPRGQSAGAGVTGRVCETTRPWRPASPLGGRRQGRRRRRPGPGAVRRGTVGGRG
ncbi:hypothetical protein SAM23877_7250 [Streptomyces ambofaciens ATCC 23877]|uniref:Uncharacterized protein n=1 Tax=Streptomyces ambofaciens (strain ATCC 23877 / 3486 / DSM 40053 / JCM 4204 / NBRC 12836 / NRRL B-2516) TaxID=278992 RepID=A0A0K2B4Y1_STRA7|nr:hypothetical protein SAM23877_7250 [Streptomyces ambofaciens ATCC 23877]